MQPLAHLLWLREAYRPRVYRDFGVTRVDPVLRGDSSGKQRSSCTWLRVRETAAH